MKSWIVDPEKLGRLEAGWWIAHNKHDKIKMMKLLEEQNMCLYNFDQTQAAGALMYLAEGVKHHDSRDWNKAIESLTNYYQKVKDKTKLDFEAKIAAELEVGWWKLHDELEHISDKQPLAEAFTKLYSCIYSKPKERIVEAGKLKAAATYEHDLAEDPQTDPIEVEKHWENTKNLLVRFYMELKRVVD
jgi:hypothetical protein